jgi:hypothetical protein
MNSPDSAMLDYASVELPTSHCECSLVASEIVPSFRELAQAPLNCCKRGEGFLCFVFAPCAVIYLAFSLQR